MSIRFHDEFRGVPQKLRGYRHFLNLGQEGLLRTSISKSFLLKKRRFDSDANRKSGTLCPLGLFSASCPPGAGRVAGQVEASIGIRTLWRRSGGRVEGLRRANCMSRPEGIWICEEDLVGTRSRGWRCFSWLWMGRVGEDVCSSPDTPWDCVPRKPPQGRSKLRAFKIAGDRSGTQIRGFNSHRKVQLRSVWDLLFL